MALVITAGGAMPVQASVWQIEMPPHQIRLFGDCRRAEGERSVLLISGARFDADAKTLTFDAGAVTPLNVGRTSVAVAVGGEGSFVIGRDNVSLTATSLAEIPAYTGAEPTPSAEAYGPGDREFLRVADEMPRLGRQIAERLLAEVRKRSPGDLKRGQQRNFSNTPDNFWYVIVQTRIGELAVTVRGAPGDFNPSKLSAKKDRPGYTRFKVARPEDVDEAVQLIFESKRKR